MGWGTGKKARQSLSFILTFIIVLMIVSSYSNTFTSPPYLDDFHTFINVLAFYPHSLSLSTLLAISRTQSGWARFLPDVTFALNHYFGHGKLIYFHAVNILIHLLAFFAVFWFVGLLLAAENKEQAGNEVPYETVGLFALCVAAIWALSPVQTAAVTYLVQRIASMAALFYTLSAACFIKGRLVSGKNSRSAAVWYFLCALAGLCAGLSKQNSAMLPVMLAVIDVWFFESAWLKKAWDFSRKTGWKLRALAAAVFLSSSYWAFFVELPRILSGYAIRNFTLTERLLTEARVVVWYMSLMLWPVPSRLAMEHDPRISTSLFHPFTTIPALLFIGVLFFLAVRFRKRFPVITFGIIWFFLNLIIESTIIPLELVFEQRLYLPSVGFYLAVAALIAILLRKAAWRLPQAEFAKAACSLLLVCASFFGLLTFSRNCAWKNPISIRLDTVQKAPDSPRANADVANILCEAGRYGEAIKYAEKAINLSRKGNEDYSLAQNAITVSLTKQGKPGEAIQRAQKFLNFVATSNINVGSFPDVCLNVVQACLKEKKPKQAYKWALTALKYIQLSNDGSLYKKGLVKASLIQIFSLYDADQVNPALGAAVAPFIAKTRLKASGVRPVSMARPYARDPAVPVVLTAMVFNAYGEEQFASGILEREYAKEPANPLVKAEIGKLRKEEAQDRAQKKNWNDFRKYVRNPFSRFNFDMAVAYLVQKDQLPKLFQYIGNNRIDAALKISPDSRDALLLKAWYLYSGNHAVLAAKDARKILAGDPKNSNVWLALGFFRIKAGNGRGAVAAFEKVIELFPGYSRRIFLEQLCSRLSTGMLLKSGTVIK